MKSSINGNDMLKIIVMIMMEPMVIYQSEVMSRYWPWNKNSNYLGERSFLKLKLSKTMIRPMFMIRMKERLSM